MPILRARAGRAAQRAGLRALAGRWHGGCFGKGMGKWRTIGAVLALGLGGCAGVPGPAARWVQDQGGLLHDQREARVQRVSADLVRLALGRAQPVGVLDDGAIAAYAWPGGAVYVTRGLVDAMDDAELRAAVAHELGHLLDARAPAAGVALRGCAAGLAREGRADAQGCALLRAAGGDAGAMARLLTKTLAATAPTDPCRAGLAQRRRWLTEP